MKGKSYDGRRHFFSGNLREDWFRCLCVYRLVREDAGMRVTAMKPGCLLTVGGVQTGGWGPGRGERWKECVRWRAGLTRWTQ